MLTGTGVWSMALRYADPDEIAESAAELESLGYTAMWIPDFGDDVFAALEHLLDATSSMTVATGVMNVWRQTPEATNAWWTTLSAEHQARVLLGLGVSHRPLVGAAWAKPLATMQAFLDNLDVPEEHRCLAALGPKMQELARERTAGTHLYLVTPEHTARARDALGPSALVAVEQGVVLEADADAARGMVREELQLYAGLPNYTNNWKRVGFTEEDVATLSDPLIDGLFAWGSVGAIADRVAEHRAAGANHVCLQVVPSRTLHRAAWKALARI